MRIDMARPVRDRTGLPHCHHLQGVEKNFDLNYESRDLSCKSLFLLLSFRLIGEVVVW